MAASSTDSYKSDTTMVVGLALLNGLLIATNVGMLSYVVDNVLEGKIHKNSVPNAATQYLLIFTAAAVLIGLTSILLGFIHSARRNHAIRASAFSLSLAATILYFLSLGFGAKQTKLGGEGSVEKAIFALDVILVVTGSLYTLVLYMGLAHDTHTGVKGVHTGAPAGAVV
jgi:ABC-type multidrug transport system fused ATPase/permease subunit